LEAEELVCQQHLATAGHWIVEKSEMDQESVNQWRWMKMKNDGDLLEKKPSHLSAGSSYNCSLRRSLWFLELGWQLAWIR